MNSSDLKPGDVLLFSGEKGSLLSEAIMFLTGAPVSHAAMTYTDSARLIEETPPAVQVNDAASRFKGRKISVMRLNPPQPDVEPVLHAATGYLNNDEPYATANLFLLGLLLLYKKFTPSGPVQKAMLKIFKKLAADIITAIDKHEYPGKLPMVCSQFVFQCYEDAGKGYCLRIKDGVLTRLAAPETQSVLDQAIYRVKNDTSAEFRRFIAANAGLALRAREAQSGEELAGELLQALRETAGAEGVPLEAELVLAVHELGQALYAARTGAAVNDAELRQANALRMATTGLGLLKTEEAAFVTPADLLDHCLNLEKAGEITD